eukprot:2173506-Rhodomonas_salina.1
MRHMPLIVFRSQYKRGGVCAIPGSTPVWSAARQASEAASSASCRLLTRSPRSSSQERPRAARL